MNYKLRLDSLLSLFFLLISMIFTSCYYKKTSSNLELNDFKLDTLIFSSENEVIDLGEGGEFLLSSDMSDDASSYFIFNLEKRLLYTLDLKSKKLQSKLEMPSEGPDGIGDWLIDFQRLDNQNFIAEGDNVFYFFNEKGKLLDKIRVDHLFYLNPELVKKFPNVGFLYKDGQFHFSTVEMGKIGSQVLSYNPKSDSFLLREIPFIDLIKNSSITSMVKSFTFYSSPSFVINDFPGGILVLNKSLPNMTAYLNNGDTVSTKPNSSKFFEDLEPVEEIFIAKNDAEEKEFKKELEKQMNFLRPVVDEQNQKLYRLGYRLASDDVSYDTYLFEYDLNLTLTRETQLEGVKIKPKKMFLRDSTFYLAVSFDDEPGLLIFRSPF